MAQLRDASTSECIAIGDAPDLLIIADELGHDAVLWDDVGAAFDIDALRAQVEHQAQANAKEAQAREQALAALAEEAAAVAASASDPEVETLPPVDLGAALE